MGWTLIGRKEFEEISGQAWEVVANLIGGSNPLLDPPEFFENQDYAITALTDFLELSTGLAVVEGTLDPGYGSWITEDDTGNVFVVLDKDQLMSWFQKSGKQVVYQKIITLIHEYAHTQMTPELLVGKARSATVYQEAVAWTFTYSFIAALMTSYSLWARENRQVDDPPRFTI